jgi:ABC-2 type transport system ATP-binding protein
MNFAVEANELNFRYGKKNAIRNFTINLNENQMIGLIGRNGSGKTTFLKLCAGLLSPYRGSIQVFSKNPVNYLSILQEIIYSYSEVTHRSSLSLERIIEDMAMFYPHFDTVFAYRLIEFFSLSRHDRYSSLSKGMTSAFNFICAISTRSKLTLLDEPLLGMDISIRKKVYDILLRDFIENPRTIIISSHILSELEDLLSEFLIIDGGQIILYKNQEELNSMAYRIEGSKDAVKTFIEGRPVIYEEYKVTTSCAVIEAAFDEAAEIVCRQQGLTVSRVCPEDLYLYKTSHGKGMDFDCLWEN